MIFVVVIIDLQQSVMHTWNNDAVSHKVIRKSNGLNDDKNIRKIRRIKTRAPPTVPTLVRQGPSFFSITLV